MTAVQDKWSKWLLETRFGGDERAAEQGMRMLRRMRDRVLRNARLCEGDTLLDVGSGDGLIAFGALDLVGERGHVILSDISQPLLDHTRGLAEEMGVAGRCRWVNASADDLRAIDGASVDVITTRSVLIYVSDKAAAFREFHRVLKPGGRASLFEPINRLTSAFNRERGWGGPLFDPVRELATRLGDYYADLQPAESDPMLDFDDRDLVRLCEEAQFERIHLELHVDVSLNPPYSYDAMINSPGNPRVPPMAQVMQEIFTAEEIIRFEEHVRPAIESGRMVQRDAVSYVRAVKAGGEARVQEDDNDG